jgi:hypothetical protein
MKRFPKDTKFILQMTLWKNQKINYTKIIT